MNTDGLQTEAKIGRSLNGRYTYTLSHNSTRCVWNACAFKTSKKKRKWGSTIERLGIAVTGSSTWRAFAFTYVVVGIVKDVLP